MSTKLHCDFCGKEINELCVGEWLCSNDGKRYHFEIRVKGKPQTHFKKVDCCFWCMAEFFVALIDQGKAKESPVVGDESPALNTKEICHTAPNSRVTRGAKRPHCRSGNVVTRRKNG
jgi:hypothetical protein